MTDERRMTVDQVQAALGSIVGSAAGDALGAPFEFGPSGQFTAAFPAPVRGGLGEMTGGGSFDWAPGEFTDDTQLALAVAESLVAADGTFDPTDMWARFRAWSESARDIGITTAAALASTSHEGAARRAHERLGRSGSNGSVMRVAPVGVAGVRWSEEETIEVARRQSDLTHFAAEAGWSAAVAAAVIRRLIMGDELESVLPEVLQFVADPVAVDMADLLAVDWREANPPHRHNGDAMVCLAQALWAVRSTSTFADAVTTAIDLGDDTDTVAAVTGAIAGALYGIQAVPSRWTSHLHGWLQHPDGGKRRYDAADLMVLAHALIGVSQRGFVEREPAVGPALVDPVGLYAANLMGATQADDDMAIVSLCRGEGLFTDRSHRREIYLIDKTGYANSRLFDVVDDAVASIDAFLAEGRRVVVHCHGGRSRTGLVLKAWYMRANSCSHVVAEQWLDDIWPLYSTWNHTFSEFLDNEWEVDR
jgi:ADP-ribosyl-[dinitrogen reductase] hydrolase